jgi:hypothetical protein
VPPPEGEHYMTAHGVMHRVKYLCQREPEDGSSPLIDTSVMNSSAGPEAAADAAAHNGTLIPARWVHRITFNGLS